MIENRKKIVLTDSAVKRLEKLHERLNVQIENYLIDRKFVPGDDFVEVTGSDIDDVENRLKIIRPTSLNTRRTILYMYMILGIVIFLIGVFYNEIKDILTGDRDRLILLTVGFFLSLASFFFSTYFKQKDKIQKDYLEFEERKLRSKEYSSHQNIKL